MSTTQDLKRRFCTSPSDEQKRERIRAEWAAYVHQQDQEWYELLASYPDGGASPKALLIQEFDGEVTSVSDESVTIEFLVEDDTEVRHFRRGDVDPDHPLQVGDPVQVRCELKFIPPRPPMTDSQVQDWKKKHAWMEKLQKRIKQPKSLLAKEPKRGKKGRSPK
jgi:hypothetical protein